MDIILDKNLQELRRKKGNTQEELADFLSISSQAVSKWERAESLPDVCLLPKIAAYYNVTVDDLLGVGEIKKQEKIAEYKAEGEKFSHTGEAEKRIEVWRKAVTEFPNDLDCLSNLLHALHIGSNQTEEVIELGRRILRESTDNTQRYNATQILVLSLMRQENYDEAEKLIATLPHMYVTYERLICDLDVNKGNNEKGKKETCGNILDYFELIGMDLYNLCVFNKGNYEHYIRLHEVFLKIAGVIFDDGFYGFFNSRIYLRHYWLAKLYTNLHGDEDKARYHLESAAKCAKDYDNLPEKFTYKGTLFGDGLESGQEDIFRNSTVPLTECLLHSIDGKGLDDPSFDRWHGKDWFNAVVKNLNAEK